MKRPLSLILCIVLLASVMLAMSCAPGDRMYLFMNKVVEHGHARMSIIDRTAPGLWVVLQILNQDGKSALSIDGAPLPAEDLSSASVQPRTEIPSDNSSLLIASSAKNPFFDHELDGVWQGRSTINFEGGSGQLPFLIVANASDGWCYLSVVFQDINRCFDTGKADWTAVYTDEVRSDPGSSEFHFEKVASSLFAPFVPDIAKLDFSYSSYVVKDRFFGRGEARPARRKKTIFTTSDEFLKMKKTGGIRGLWSSGFTDRVYAGEFLDPPVFHPTVISLMERSNELDMNLYVLLGHQENITAAVNGKRLTFEFWTPNGLVDGDFSLDGKTLVGRVWDPLTVTDKELTFAPAGTEGKTPKLKRVKPKTVSLSTPGRSAKLTVIGKDFAPGAMVFFDNQDIRLKSVQFVSKKKLKVKVAAVNRIAAGTAVGVMVLNPDNRSAKRARAFRTR
ncbi:MAG: hypothetical protein GY769_10195 [bacterium]|nr:hypothetical protein [bacterium]